MRWTREYVWSKVLDLVPTAKLANQALPEALRDAAVELFLKDEGLHNGSYRAYVIEQAIKELRVQGHLEFGTVCEDWEQEKRK